MFYPPIQIVYLLLQIRVLLQFEFDKCKLFDTLVTF